MAELDGRIFTIDEVQFQFPGNLLSMAVGNNILLMALDNNRLKRIDLQQAKQVEGSSLFYIS